MRAIFYFDYLFSQNQTAPVQWFGYEPWWSKLSFHDHPPLVFLIQHAFFSRFGTDNLIAKLPFAIAGALSLLFMFGAARELYGRRTALVSTLLLAINNHFIWASRVGYLEIFVTAFTLLSLFFLLKSRTRPLLLLAAAAAWGLALLSKYTAFFFAPVFIAQIIIQRSAIPRKILTCAFLILALILSPLVIYNAEMYAARGHFDMQLSALFGQSFADWPVITRSLNTQIWSGMAPIVRTLMDAVGTPMVILFAGALAVLAYEILRGVKRLEHLILLNVLFSLTLLFLLIGNAHHYLSLYAPLLALAVGYALVYVFDVLRSQPRPVRTLASICFGILAGSTVVHQIFYTVNTNHAYRPRGIAGRDYAAMRIDNAGFLQLDRYFASLLAHTKAIPQNLPKEYKRIPWLLERSDKGMQDQTKETFSSLLLYDRNINWFGRVWVFDKRYLTGGYLSYSFDDFVIKHQQDPSLLRRAGVSSAYIILPAKKNKTLSPADSNYSLRESMVADYLAMNELTPLTTIYNQAGEACFIIYFIPDYLALVPIIS